MQPTAEPDEPLDAIPPGPSVPSTPEHATTAFGTWEQVLHRGASRAFFLSVAGAGLGFAAHVLVARLIGRSDYGIYALMLSWISVLAVVAQAGQDHNVVRFLPTYIIRGQLGLARGLRLGIGLLVLGVSVAIALTGCIVVAWLGSGHDWVWRATFYVGFATLPILAQLQQSGAMHRAFKRAASANAYGSVLRPIILILFLLAWAAFSHNINGPIAAAANGLGAVGALAASASHLSLAWPKTAADVRAEYALSAWAKTGVRLSVFSIIWVVGYRVDVLVLGALLPLGDVGTYYAATTIAAFCGYPLNAVNVAFGPLIVERYDAGDLAGLRAIARRAALISFAGALAVGVLIVLLGRWALGLFGPGFEFAYVPLLILVCGGCVISAFGPVDAILALTNYQTQVSFFVLLGMVLNGLTAVVLVPHFGAIGAAIAFALAMVVWRALALGFAVRHLGVAPLWIRARGTTISGS